jgi:hypothetical protein
MPRPTKKRQRRRNGRGVVPATPTYVPTKHELASLSAVIERIESTPPHARMKVEARPDATHLSWEHPSQPIAAALWANALGTGDLEFAGVVFEQLAQLARSGSHVGEKELNHMLSLVRGLAPRDSTEALLVTQMAAIHCATMASARRLAQAETREGLDSHASALNKFARTFASQMEALKRYRTGGEQTIKVQHVTVNDGGQAIVGDVRHTGATLTSENQCHEQLPPPDASGAALLGPFEANGLAMPSPGRQGQTRVPVPRRARGRTKG